MKKYVCIVCIIFVLPATTIAKTADYSAAQMQNVVDEAYAEGLADLEGFSHIILIYQFHRSQGFDLRVKPFLDDHERGLFSTRAPRRPNPIGLSVVPLVKREGNRLEVQGIDVLDGTPLIDIKPFVPAFDAPEVSAIGWLEGKEGLEKKIRSDDRFSSKR